MGISINRELPVASRAIETTLIRDFDHLNYRLKLNPTEKGTWLNAEETQLAA